MFGRNRFRAKGDASKYGKRHTPGQMNQTESAFANELEAQKLTGLIVEWRFEAKRFILAPGVQYTPDFEIIHTDGQKEYIDVKGAGPMDDKSRVKIKVVAEKWWEYKFTICKRLPKKAGGGWQREEF